jgi:hypothetical protein
VVVAADDRRPPDVQVEVARIGVHDLPTKGVEIHVEAIGKTIFSALRGVLHVESPSNAT